MEKKSKIVKQECTFIRYLGRSKPRWQSCCFSQIKESYWKASPDPYHVRNGQEEIAKNIQMQKGNRFNTYTLCKSNQSLDSLSKNDISFTKIGTLTCLIIVLQILLFFRKFCFLLTYTVHTLFRIYTFIDVRDFLSFQNEIFTYINEKKSFLHLLKLTSLLISEKAAT